MTITKEAIEAGYAVSLPQGIRDERSHRERFEQGLRAALSTLPIAGEGWQLVPVKPTMEMVKNAAGDHEGENWLPHSLWASMLAAAPVPPSSPGKDGGQEVEALASFVSKIASISDDFIPDRDADAALALQEMRDALKEAIASVVRPQPATEHEEFYARGYGLRCMVVDHLNGAIDKAQLRNRFYDWESASGTKFLVIPADIAKAEGR